MASRRPAPAPTAVADVPVVGPREPCPCGSGRRYKACHGRPGAVPPPVMRPFEGLPSEPDWVALREIVPAATASLRLRDHADRRVTLATLLPMAWPGLVRPDGEIVLGLQAAQTGSDLSRSVAAVIELALEGEPGLPVVPPETPESGPRLQDLLGPEALEVTVHDGFDFWLTDEPTPEASASLERANAAAAPTARLTSVEAAYWTRMGEKSHLRWALPEDEDAALDALARLAASGEGLSLGEGTRYAGSFRAGGLLIPVWDLPPESAAPTYEEPAAALRVRLDEALAQTGALSPDERRARSGLIGRQVTLR